MASEVPLRRNDTKWRVRQRPATWSFPATRVDQVRNPSLCSNQTEPHSVTRIDCSDVVLIKRQPGRATFMQWDRLPK